MAEHYIGTLAEFEQKKYRTKASENEIGKLFTRVYGIPAEARSLIPARGSVLTLQNDDPLSGDQGSTNLFKARVITTVHGFENEEYIVRISAILPVPYSSEGSSTTYQEVRGSRDEHEGPTRNIATVIGISTDGTGGPSKGDFFSGDSGLLGRRCNDIVKDKEAVPGLVVIRAAYTAFVAFDANTGGLVEIRGNRRLRRKNRFMSVGVREFICQTEAAPGIASDLYGTLWPNAEGEYAPRCYEPETIDHPEGIPAISMIRANYRSKDRRDISTDEARLITTISSRQEKRHVLKDGTVIHGIVPGSDGRNRRRIVRGSESVLVFYPSYIVQAQMARISIPYDKIKATVGGLNKNSWTKPKATKGELLFVGAKIIESTGERATVAYYLDGNYEGWDKATTVRSEALKLIKLPVLNESDLESGARVTRIWEQKKKYAKADDSLPVDAKDVTFNDFDYVDLGFIRSLPIVD